MKNTRMDREINPGKAIVFIPLLLIVAAPPGIFNEQQTYSFSCHQQPQNRK